MDTDLLFHRWHFAFTITYHYLFPQLTMGLALLIMILKTLGLRTRDRRYDRAARFWAKIFAISFAMGVVTGIPMEFQFGTNWARFADAAGGVIGQTLAMEGVFAFFMESSFLGLFLFGEKLLGRVGHWLSAVAVWLGSWLSGFFIVATNAWMQNPTGYRIDAQGRILLDSFWGLLGNPWLLWQYSHVMLGATVTGAFVMAGIGAFYLLSKVHREQARTFVRLGVVVGLPAAVLLAFPTGDSHARMASEKHPVGFAAMEGLFETTTGAPLALIGQPNVEEMKLDNPIEMPHLLSFLTYRRWNAKVVGLKAYPKDLWPDSIPLLYYSYHVMVGLGTIYIGVLVIAAFLLWRRKLFDFKPMLWVLLLAVPFPFISNTAGWMTAELSRQPWVIYGLQRTREGSSSSVASGNVLFTLIGFMGMYTVLSILFLFLVRREIEHGPAAAPEAEAAPGHQPPPGAATDR